MTKATRKSPYASKAGPHKGRKRVRARTRPELANLAEHRKAAREADARERHRRTYSGWDTVTVGGEIRVSQFIEFNGVVYDLSQTEGAEAFDIAFRSTKPAPCDPPPLPLNKPLRGLSPDEQARIIINYATPPLTAGTKLTELRMEFAVLLADMAQRDPSFKEIAHAGHLVLGVYGPSGALSDRAKEVFARYGRPPVADGHGQPYLDCAFIDGLREAKSKSELSAPFLARLVNHLPPCPSDARHDLILRITKELPDGPRGRWPLTCEDELDEDRAVVTDKNVKDWRPQENYRARVDGVAW